MISDTLWQKFIYDIPFDDDEMPLLNSRKTVIDVSKKTFTISGLSLYGVSEDSFKEICKSLKGEEIMNVVIINDYQFQSNNLIVVKGAEAHMMSFCYLFQKNGFNSIVFNKL